MFASDSTYKCVLNRRSGNTSQVKAFGVTVDPNAEFILLDTGTGTLPTVFIVINNISNLAISNTFTGLPEGHILRSKGTNFKVSYKGGNGNDMTLTVVP